MVALFWVTERDHLLLIFAMFFGSILTERDSPRSRYEDIEGNLAAMIREIVGPVRWNFVF